MMIRIIGLSIFLLAIIFFLLPWVNVSCAGTEIYSVSGFDMVRGSYNIPSEIADETPMENEPLAVYALVAAGVGLVFSLFGSGFGRILRVLAGIAGVVLMVWLKFKIDDQIKGTGEWIVQVNYLIGYWLTLCAFALGTVVNLFKKT
jgi:hypothetical protein